MTDPTKRYSIPMPAQPTIQAPADNLPHGSPERAAAQKAFRAAWDTWLAALTPEQRAERRRVDTPWMPRIPMPDKPRSTIKMKALRGDEQKAARARYEAELKAIDEKWLASLTPAQLAEHIRIETYWARVRAEQDAQQKQHVGGVAGATGPAQQRTPRPERPARGQYVTKNLKKFLAIGAATFDIGKWLDGVAPEDTRYTYEDGLDFKCPNEDGHSDPKPDDRAFRVWNGDGDGFGAFCQHNGCRTESSDDRAWYLDKLCDAYGVADAASLLDWCDLDARKTWNAKRDGKVEHEAPPVSRRLRCRRLSEVQPKAIQYLIPDMIPRKLLSLLAGPTGVAKSLCALHIAATVTQGYDFKRGNVSRLTARRERAPADVVIIAGEDTTEEMLRPRAEAAGVDMTRVHVIEGVQVVKADGVVEEQRFSLEHAAADLDALLGGADGGNVRLVIIDPIHDFVGKIDAHRNNEVRAALTPLVELAKKYDVAILLVHHSRKDAKLTSVLDAVSGSTAFVELPKFIAVLAPENPAEREANRFIFQVEKQSNGRPGHRLLYEVEGHPIYTATGEAIHTGRFNILEDEEATVSIFQAMRGTGADPEKRTLVDEAKDFLCQMLADGPLPVKRIMAEGKGLGHTERNLQRAKAALKIVGKHSTELDGGWLWFSPGVTAEQATIAALAAIAPGGRFAEGDNAGPKSP